MLTLFNKIFTWWNQDTFGTRLKTIFFGKYVGVDSFGNKYYESKKGKRWVIYSKDVEATKITNDWYLWIHHTTNQIPNKNEKKHNWQKEHNENLTGTNNAYKPSKIKKSIEHKKYENWKIAGG